MNFGVSKYVLLQLSEDAWPNGGYELLFLPIAPSLRPTLRLKRNQATKKELDLSDGDHQWQICYTVSIN
jgi:hypothetical protein